MMNSDDLKGVISTDALHGKLTNESSMVGAMTSQEIKGIISMEGINSSMENTQNLVGTMLGSQADRGITNIYLNGIEQEVSGKVAYLDATYEMLEDKPKINSVELKNDKSFEDLGANALTNTEIENIINSMV